MCGIYPIWRLLAIWVLHKKVCDGWLNNSIYVLSLFFLFFLAQMLEAGEGSPYSHSYWRWWRVGKRGQAVVNAADWWNNTLISEIPKGFVRIYDVLWRTNLVIFNVLKWIQRKDSRFRYLEGLLSK